MYSKGRNTYPDMKKYVLCIVCKYNAERTVRLIYNSKIMTQSYFVLPHSKIKYQGRFLRSNNVHA